MSEPRQRLFLALWPDHETAEHLHALAGNLARHSVAGGRVVPPDRLHLTLAFIGSLTLPERARVEAALDALRADACDIQLTRFGFWPAGGVVYAGCAGDSRDAPLLAVFRAVRTALRGAGIGEADKPARPHITLARRVRGIDLPRLGAPLCWRADDISLVMSECVAGGVRYTPQAQWPLCATPAFGDD